MATLYFFVAVLAVAVLTIQLLLTIMRKRSPKPALIKLAGVVLAYLIVWVICYLKQTDKPIASGTDICFDDWCATILKIDTPGSLGEGNGAIKTNGHFIVLQVQMSNHARGIAQKPSEPRIHIIDDAGHSWAPSMAAQQALELQQGKQTALDVRLELSQQLQTQMAFDIPKNATGLKVLIEEGPFITKLLFAEDREVFLINPQ